jgi:hypothetical protein
MIPPTDPQDQTDAAQAAEAGDAALVDVVANMLAILICVLLLLVLVRATDSLLTVAEGPRSANSDYTPRAPDTLRDTRLRHMIVAEGRAIALDREALARDWAGGGGTDGQVGPVAYRITDLFGQADRPLLRSARSWRDVNGFSLELRPSDDPAADCDASCAAVGAMADREALVADLASRLSETGEQAFFFVYPSGFADFAALYADLTEAGYPVLWLGLDADQPAVIRHSPTEALFR